MALSRDVVSIILPRGKPFETSKTQNKTKSSDQ